MARYCADHRRQPKDGHRRPHRTTSWRRRWDTRPATPRLTLCSRICLRACAATLGPQLVGVYLDGSLAAGGFAEHSSDIDVLVVTESVLSDDVVTALGMMHARLATGTSKWVQEPDASTSLNYRVIAHVMRAERMAASEPTDPPFGCRTGFWRRTGGWRSGSRVRCKSREA